MAHLQTLALYMQIRSLLFSLTRPRFMSVMGCKKTKADAQMHSPQRTHWPFQSDGFDTWLGRGGCVVHQARRVPLGSAAHCCVNQRSEVSAAA